MADFYVCKYLAPRTTGALAQSIFIDIVNTLGAPATAISNATAGILCTYAVDHGNPVAITLSSLAANTSSWNGSGFIELSAGLMPGKYRLDLPNACFANTTACEVVVWKTGTFYGSVSIPTLSNTSASLAQQITNAAALVQIVDDVQDLNVITVDAIAAGIPVLDVANNATGVTTH